MKKLMTIAVVATLGWWVWTQPTEAANTAQEVGSGLGSAANSATTFLSELTR
jgi:hypothetical protein